MNESYLTPEAYIRRLAGVHYKPIWDKLQPEL